LINDFTIKNPKKDTRRKLFLDSVDQKQ